jgi:dipeptidyl aminopeptidase/acylaminoacyl peptidase
MLSIPAEAFYDRTRLTDVDVSPDGERVAFCTREYDPDEDEPVDSLWVVPADGSRDPHRLSRASDAGDPRWSPDGSRLGFLAARKADPDLRVGRDADDEEAGEAAETGDDGRGANGDDGPKTQVWAFEMERGGDARQVTDREEGVSGFDWSPDGERVVVAARDPTDDERASLERRREDGPVEVERLQHKFDGRGYLDEVTSYLFVVDYASREERRLDDANDGGYAAGRGLDPAWGTGNRIAFTTNHTDWPDDNYVRDVYTISPDGGDRRKVTDGELTASHARWSPDGERLAFLARPPENLYAPTEVYVADVDAGAYDSVSGDLDRTVAWGGEPRWVDDRTLVALIGDGGWSRLVRLSVDEPPARVFEVQDRIETLRQFDAAGETVAVATSRPAEGTEVDAFDVEDLRADADDGDPRVRLTQLDAPIVDEYPQPDCRRIAFDSPDGTEIEALVYHPADFDPSDPDPRGLVLEIHGGPMAYDEPGFRFLDAFFVSRGYLVCRVNYRGSTSYGRAFCEELRGAWGTVEVEDLQAAVDELLDRGWADPHRLFPTGFSQGGVNTAYLVTRDDRWTAAAAEHGVYDLRSDFGTADAHNWYEADYGLPWENPEAYDDHSPITDVGGVSTPLLVTAGEADWRCPPSQSEQLYVSVRKQGVDAKLVVYPDEHHDVGDPDRAIHRLEALDDWFARYDPAREADAGEADG